MDDEPLTVQKTTVTYDAPIVFDIDPKAEIIGQTHDYCEVTFVIDPETDEMEVHMYPIAHGVHIFFVSDKGYSVYGDEALEKDVTGEDTISEGEAMDLYVITNE